MSKRVTSNISLQCHDFKYWKSQTDFVFGFIRLSDLILPKSTVIGPGFQSPIDQHYVTKDFCWLNFLGAHIPMKSQLNIAVWEDWLQDYWDKQLIELPNDEAYVAEETSHEAILGPFDNNPITHCHYSPFMTREKS